MPGLQQSGCLWHALARKVLHNLGWQPVRDSADDVFFKSLPGGVVMTLALYVDDLLLVGPRGAVDAETRAMSKKFAADPDLAFELGSVGPLRRFLGTVYEIVSKPGAEYTIHRARQEDYIKAMVVDFLSVANKASLRKAAVPVVRESAPPEDFEQPGRLGQEAPRFIGELLWVARCSRPDIAYAVSLVARFSANWCRAADRFLEKIVSYLAGSSDLGLHFWVKEGDRLHAVGLCDADHGSCPLSARSTSGMCVYLAGVGGSSALVAWGARRQTCTASSTGEAEVVAANDLFKSFLFPLGALVDQVSGEEVLTAMGSDASVAISALTAGVSTMRYLRKNHRISLAAVSDNLKMENVKLVKVDTESNASDIFTKALAYDRFAFLRGLLGVWAPAACPPMAPTLAPDVLREAMASI